MAGDIEDHRQPGADEHAETCAADGTTHCLRYATPSGAQAWCHRQLVELRAVVREPKDHERAARRRRMLPCRGRGLSKALASFRAPRRDARVRARQPEV
jgi:hypothetical protein